MADDSLLAAAARISDGEVIDWVSVTATLRSEEDRAIADELALLQSIALGHRKLHEVLPLLAETPPHLMPDRARWGHLDLLNIVGSGSYGMVYRAWDTRLERLVALKLFHGASHPDSVMQEGRMLARVRHENVVIVHGADVLDGVAGIWMELVHGETLDLIVKKRGPLPAREAAAVGADIARALGAVHAAALLHCDVKAQNVVRENSGRVVLMDLGAGRLAPEARDMDQPVTDVAGTPRYMAPELFAHGATATKSSDLYSLGVLLYYLVSGEYPVDGKTLGELKRAHEAKKVRALGDIRPDLPRPLVEIISRAIERDPALRPAAAGEMQSALTAVAMDDSEPAVPQSRKWWWALAAAAALTAAVLVAPLFRNGAAAPPLAPAQSIAVLPIKNLTGDPSKQYLADGLTEVLTAYLARLPGLQVASSAMTVTAGRTAADEKALAGALRVRLLLAGSVLQAGDRITLSVKLTDAAEGREVWGTELERTADDILGARSEIAALIAARLSLAKVPQDATREQPSREAQDAFLNGLAELRVGPSAQGTGRAIESFKRASGLAPAWGEPLAHLAYAQQLMVERGNPLKRSEGAAEVRANALKALQMDSGLSMAYTALAAVQAYHDWDFQGAEATLRQAIEANPRNGEARGRLAFLLAAENRLPEAVAEARVARDQEPLLPERHGTLAMVHYYARQWDEALADADRALALSADFGLAHLAKGLILGASGKPAEGAESIRLAMGSSENPGWLAALGVTCARAGQTDCVTDVLRRLREFEAGGGFVSVDQYAYIAAYQNRLDEAFRLLNEAVDRKMTNVLWLAVDPRADALRNDPRFEQIVSRMGLATR